MTTYVEYLNALPASIKNLLPGDMLAENEFQPTNRNKLTNNKFLFIMNRCPSLTYFCQRANIPEVSTGISLQSNPTAIDIRRPGTRHIFGDLLIGFVVDENLKNWLEVYNWIRDLSTDTYAIGDILSEKQKTAGAVLHILSSAYAPILQVKYYNIFPTALTAVEFDSTAIDSEVSIASATFSYTYYDIETMPYG